MPPGLSTTNVANPWLSCITAGGATRTVVAGTYAQIHVGDPGVNGTANVSAGSTTRVAFTQTVAGGASTLSGTAPSWTNAGATETLTYVSVWDAVTGGSFLYSMILGVPAPWVSGNGATQSSLGVAVAPLAV